MTKERLHQAVAAIAAALLLCSSAARAEVILRASHQWPGGTGDLRDEMVQRVAREVAAADVDLAIRVYPGESLFKARDQWPAPFHLAQQSLSPELERIPPFS